MCLRAYATSSAIHVRLILPGECHGDYPPRLCHTCFTRIWPHEELCRFSALVDNPWKWCASCWRKIALVLKNSLRRRVFPQGSFFRFVFSFGSGCLRACHRWLRSHVEEPHQSFQVLCHSS